VATSTDAGRWKEDAEVTAVGKAGARAREVLNWALAIKDAGFTDAGNTTLKNTWSRVRDIMGVFYFIIIIIVGFGLIAKQEWAEKTRRSLPALIIAFIAAYFSYFALASIIKFTDGQIGERFYAIHNWDKTGSLESRHLRAQDLLTVSFNYQEFKGYRKVGTGYGEAVANHLLLVKITTVTNYVIAFVILLRIIILWGLVIFSPFIFPFLVFPLTKKVGIVWVREFFRWLLLGPLFALFLTSIPYIWNKTNISVKDVYPGQQAQNSGIPLEVQQGILNPSGSTDKTANNVYESGTNIILAPPGDKNPDIQKDSDITSGNNLSETDTYSRWIVALLMIWGAIILPFMLLRIIMGFSVEISKGVSNVFNNSQAAQYINNLRKVVNPTPPPPGPGPGGISRERLIEKTPTIAPVKQLNRPTVNTFSEKSLEQLSVPTMLNVAGLKQEVPEMYSFATAAENEALRKVSELAKVEQQSERSTVLNKTMTNISEPQKISDEKEQERFSKVKEGVLMRSVAGDKSAQAMKNAISGNISQYLVSDIKAEIRDDVADQFDKAVASITGQSADQGQVQQLQRAFGTAEVKNFDGVLGKLAQSQDRRAAGAVSAISKIKQASQVPAADKTAFLQKLSTNISNPELIGDPQEKQEYMALREIIEQGANSGVTSLKNLLDSSSSLSNIGTTGMQVVGSKMKDLTTAISNLSEAASKQPKYQDKIGDLKTLEAALKTAIASNNEDGLKQAARIASSVNDPSKEQDQTEKQKYNNVADLIKDSSQMGLPDAKTVQSVLDEISQDLVVDEGGNVSVSSVAALRKSMQNDQDFIQTKEIWINHYMNAPTELGKERKAWISQEVKELQTSLDNLLSEDSTKKEEALKSVQKIVPMALMGNYKASEIAKYLLAKLDAATGVLNKISSPAQASQANEELVNVTRQQGDQNKNEKIMTLEGEDEQVK